MSLHQAETQSAWDNRPLAPAGMPVAVDAYPSPSGSPEPDWLALTDIALPPLDGDTAHAARGGVVGTTVDAERQGRRIDAVILTIIFAVAAGEVIALCAFLQ